MNKRLRSWNWCSLQLRFIIKYTALRLVKKIHRTVSASQSSNLKSANYLLAVCFFYLTSTSLSFFEISCSCFMLFLCCSWSNQPNFNWIESDLRSNEHYLSSSEKKAWKKFRPVRVSQRSWVQIPYRPEFFPGLLFTTTYSNFNHHYFLNSQELCRGFQRRSKNQRCLYNLSWWQSSLWCILRADNSWLRMDSDTVEAEWLCWFQPHLRWLQTWLR